MAFIGISIAIQFGKGYETADDWAALLASTFILYKQSYFNFKPSFRRKIMERGRFYDELII